MKNPNLHPLGNSQNVRPIVWIPVGARHAFHILAIKGSDKIYVRGIVWGGNVFFSPYNYFMPVQGATFTLHFRGFEGFNFSIWKFLEGEAASWFFCLQQWGNRIFYASVSEDPRPPGCKYCYFPKCSRLKLTLAEGLIQNFTVSRSQKWGNAKQCTRD